MRSLYLGDIVALTTCRSLGFCARPLSIANSSFREIYDDRHAILLSPREFYRGRSVYRYTKINNTRDAIEKR